MEKLLKTVEIKGLINKVTIGEISFSKMVEIINLKHLEKLVELRSELKPKERMFTETEISHLQSGVHKITGNGEVMGLFNKLMGVSAG